MKRKNSILLFGALLSMFAVGANAQETKEDTLSRVIESLQSDVAILKNLKVTGYIQAQAQFADSVGAKTETSGGNFPTGSDKRFAVRRGRLKFAYSSNPLSQFAAQFDVSEKGMSAKEINAKITDPFIRFFTLTAGLQNRPYGFEIEYSSGLLESPERSRTEQTLFKDEYDLGANITIQAPKTSFYNFIKLDAGIFTGSIENTSPMDYKRMKDFIGRVNLSKSLFAERLKLSGSVSYYMGKVPTTYGTVTNGTTSNTQYYKIINGRFTRISCVGGTNLLREYVGADVQVSYDSPLGMTTLRGELTKGQQAGSKSDLKNQTVAPSDIYVRPVLGYYVMWVQNIMQTRHSLVFKYDVFDSNTKVSGNAINSANNFNSGDIKWTNIGIGYNCRLDSNVKLLVYYDINKNEKTQLTGFTKDLKDNVWTVRLQYKF